jgi:hypothetical protein
MHGVVENNVAFFHDVHLIKLNARSSLNGNNILLPGWHHVSWRHTLQFFNDSNNPKRHDFAVEWDKFEQFRWTSSESIFHLVVSAIYKFIRALTLFLILNKPYWRNGTNSMALYKHFQGLKFSVNFVIYWISNIQEEAETREHELTASDVMHTGFQPITVSSSSYIWFGCSFG